MSEIFESVAIVVEGAAVALLVMGLSVASGRFLYGATRGQIATAYPKYRKELGRTLLLTLEFLIASDIIFTVATEKTFTSLGMLGLLVLIRTFLSFALEVELSGWPRRGGDKDAVDQQKTVPTARAD